MNGYNAHTIPPLEVKTNIAPTANNKTTNGTNHHFFSWRAKAKNSLNNAHIDRPQHTPRSGP